MSLLETLVADIHGFATTKGHAQLTPLAALDALLFPGMLAVVIFRLAHACHTHRLRPLSRLLYFLNVVVFGADLAPAAEIGPGFVMPHPVGITISRGVRIGRNVHVMGLVQCGGGGHEGPGRDGFPVIGSGCWILNGAKVLGPVVVGDYAIVGANALMLKSAPRGGVMVGNPATLLKYRDGFGPASSLVNSH